MGSVAVAIIGGVVTLAGVLISNSRSQFLDNFMAK